MHRIALAFALVLGLAGCVTAETSRPTVAHARPAAAAPDPAPQCVPHPEIIARALADQFGERITAYGVDAAGALVQVYAAEAGNWTIAITRPDGVTCIVSVGEAWTTVAPAAGV